MSDSFDPLHRWLGIPPDEQPPNHYRLLGLKALEQNPDVIEAAADQRMAYVRQCATGKHAPYSQSVLNALSTARVSLLNPEKKRAYDAELKAKLAVEQPVEALMNSARPMGTAEYFPPAAVLPAIPLGDVAPGRSSPTKRPDATGTLLKYGVIAGGAALAVLLLIVVVAAMNASSPGESPKVAQRPESKPMAKKPPVPALPQPEKPVEVESPPSPETPMEKRPAAGEVAVPVLPLPQGKKVLLIFSKYPRETEAAIESCRRYGLEFEKGGFNANGAQDRTDYSAYHTIMVGSNEMDYWAENETRKRPESFAPVEKFVAGGGHLIVFGGFNGRNMEQMARFGITTGIEHSDRFLPVAEHTDVLFRGVEDLMPKDRHFRSAGHFTVSRPHVVLLQRDDNKKPPRPALVTIPFEKGRVTFTQNEPHWKQDLWLITVLCNWVARGSPVQAEDEPASGGAQDQASGGR